MTIAMVFPGQGSQSVGMMAGYGNIARETFAEASEALRQDLWRLVTEGSANELNETLNTQPIMLCAGIAVYREWLQSGGEIPAAVAGHSLGEYAALVAADVFSFPDAVKLVRFRAQAMSAAVPAGEGAMAAILGLDSEAVEALCVEAAQDEILQPANYNSGSQIVIAGQRAAVERAIKLAPSWGADRALILPLEERRAAPTSRVAQRALMLPVSGPFHSALMQPAADQLRGYLKSVPLAVPKIPVVHNADLKTHDDPAEIKDALVAQVCNPVRWVETVHLIAARQITMLIEAAPGTVLTGLNKRIMPELRSLCLTDSSVIRSCLPKKSH
ncbi:MAG: ACP S-malonyltransferase [Burkholderiales bacterium]